MSIVQNFKNIQKELLENMYLYFDECIFTFPHYNDSNGIIAFYPFDTDSTRRHILMNNIFQSLGVVLIQILLKSYFGLNNNSIIKKYDEKIDEIKSKIDRLEYDIIERIQITEILFGSKNFNGLISKTYENYYNDADVIDYFENLISKISKLI